MKLNTVHREQNNNGTYIEECGANMLDKWQYD